MKLTVTIGGDLKAMLDQETILAAAAVRRGVEAAGLQLQQQLRGQVQAAGFAGRASGLANAWRLKIYPRGGGATLHPAALVYTQAPDIIDAFEQGRPITASGRKYLCWPTGYNALGGRRGASGRGGLRVSPNDMKASRGEAAVIPTKRAGLLLWCLRVREARGQTRSGRYNRTRVRLFVGGNNVEIATGKLKAGDRKRVVERLLDRGYVAMFFLAKQVNVRKRLDVAGAFEAAEDILDTQLRAALAA